MIINRVSPNHAPLVPSSDGADPTLPKTEQDGAVSGQDQAFAALLAMTPKAEIPQLLAKSENLGGLGNAVPENTIGAKNALQQAQAQIQAQALLKAQAQAAQGQELQGAQAVDPKVLGELLKNESKLPSPVSKNGVTPQIPAQGPKKVPDWLSAMGTDLGKAPVREQLKPEVPVQMTAMGAVPSQPGLNPMNSNLAALASSIKTPGVQNLTGSTPSNPLESFDLGANGVFVEGADSEALLQPQVVPSRQLSGSEYLGLLGAVQAKSQNPSNNFSLESQAVERPALKKSLPHESALVFNPAQAHESKAAAIPFSTTAVPMRGDVIPNGGAQERLSKVSLLSLSTGIRDFSRTPGGGGEIRLKLNPESLGEMRLQVQTIGKDVSVKILASSDRSKKLIESSLSDLRDGLSLHQLTLGKIELAVAGLPQQLSTGMDQNLSNLDWNQNQSFQSSERGNEAGSNRDDRQSKSQDSSQSLDPKASSWNLPRGKTTQASPGRLDVVA